MCLSFSLSFSLSLHPPSPPPPRFPLCMHACVSARAEGRARHTTNAIIQRPGRDADSEPGPGFAFTVQEAVDTLVAEMENNRNRLVVILAGYTKEMAAFTNSNAGIDSRFPHVFEFPNYTYPEMAAIFRGMCEDRKLIVDVSDKRLAVLISEVTLAWPWHCLRVVACL